MTPSQYREILSLLLYHPGVGHFRWRRRVGGRSSVTTWAGSIDQRGYWVITYKGKRFKGHRLVWFKNHGTLPKVLDHRNGLKADNRICNLRVSSTMLNGRNRREHREGQLLGTSYRKDNGTWIAQLWVKSKKVYIGRFKTMAAAHRAYKKERAKYE